ncbi:VCBS repeat-containing protein [Tamlana fucoidanivorans]|uniref:RNA-binding protein n=1 Tax=Allotamlana fucoidanivorans TaxID=2583814 RepID=A0A5C4SN96_9FLAO|nr:VCBS repeat-containing protein [Tamlana fucoidanivorans]TNJ45268.1 RNA-binding protein [Tamlana fucoidanivorans]
MVLRQKATLRILLIIGLYAILTLVLHSCSTENKPTTTNTKQFTLVDNNHSGIHFKNTVKETLYFNFINYAYIYNGAGVAVGDINNDGLEDLFFTSNQNSNKLYLNQGDFTFEDISAKAQIEDKAGWTTGVTMIDINNDGWLDIYVCKSGALQSHELRKNKLFINQKDNTFKEEAAKYGLDHFGFSVQAYFFDYDKDSDLDMYLVNHRADFQNNTVINAKIQAHKEPYHSDQLFRNDGTTFTNVTKTAGVENKAWGLSASIGDFNNDNLPDIYVANDFLEPDFLYINQGDGTFKDEILKRFKHIAANSMGSDYADINNDLKPDLIVLDMMAEDHIRGKQNMATMSTENFNLIVNSGYHHQYMSNMLQLNNGNGTYSEIGQLAGIAKTDWSWAPLIADFDNDGYNDLFVSNGIENDLSNQDFRNQMRENIRNRKKVSLEEAISMMPSEKLSNYMYRNNQNLTFENKTTDWGIDQKVNSCGAIYTDLDNDGDLDLVLNNQSDAVSIYRNNANSNYISFKFEGSDKNTNGLGCTVSVFSQDLQQSKTLFPSRGYQSSVTNKLHFGLGKNTGIDSVIIQWPNQLKQRLEHIEINQTFVVKQGDASKSHSDSNQNPPEWFAPINSESLGINYRQKENQYDDFQHQLLLPQKQSEKGTPIAVGDVNGDTLDDLFIGNAQNAAAALYIQNSDGTFFSSSVSIFNTDKVFEDTDAQFVDIDADGDLDLYVASGGYEIEEESPLLQDRIYLNNGKGLFSKQDVSPNLMNSKKVVFADWDNDGDQDAFIAGGVIHGKYPQAYPSKLLSNENGTLTAVGTNIFPIAELAMVNDAIFSDYDQDGDLDIIAVGEWMGIVFFENKNNVFEANKTLLNSDVSGWYQTIKEIDANNDGFPEYLVGNWGNNNKFHPSETKPLHIYADYLDDNNSFDVVLSKVSKTGDLLPVRGKECSSQQTPFINDKLKTYKAFSNSTLPDIYGADKLAHALHYQATTFSSLILKNNKGVSFSVENLPIETQFSPTLSFALHDINHDGFIDVLGVGNVYDAEVETIRYDASKGYILLGNSSGKFTCLKDLSFFNDFEAKAIKKITIKGQTHMLILNKNSTLNIFKLKS